MPINTHFMALQLLFSCTQKPYAKTPQKSSKNLWQKSLTKTLQKFGRTKTFIYF